MLTRAGALLDRQPPEQHTPRDRIEDLVGQRRGAEHAVGVDVEERCRLQLEDVTLRGDKQRLVEAALNGQAPGQHVAGIGERLGAAEHPPRRVDHEGETQQLGRLRHGLGQDEALPAPGEHDPHVEALGRHGRDEHADVPLDLPTIAGEADGRAGALEPVEMLRQGEGAAGVDADELEGAIAAQQALVGGRDGRPADRAKTATHHRRILLRPADLSIAVCCHPLLAANGTAFPAPK